MTLSTNAQKNMLCKSRDEQYNISYVQASAVVRADFYKFDF